MEKIVEECYECKECNCLAEHLMYCFIPSTNKEKTMIERVVATFKNLHGEK